MFGEDHERHRDDLPVSVGLEGAADLTEGPIGRRQDLRDASERNPLRVIDGMDCVALDLEGVGVAVVAVDDARFEIVPVVVDALV